MFRQFRIHFWHGSIELIGFCLQSDEIKGFLKKNYATFTYLIPDSLKTIIAIENLGHTSER